MINTCIYVMWGYVLLVFWTYEQYLLLKHVGTYENDQKMLKFAELHSIYSYYESLIVINPTNIFINSLKCAYIQYELL